MKKKTKGAPRIYNFSNLLKGKRITLTVDHPRSCQNSAYYYAKLHGISVKSKIIDNQVIIIPQ